MTGRFVITAFAGALLSVSSCMKVETDRSGVPVNAITFEVVDDGIKPSSRVRTKAAFPETSTFISSAFLLPEGQSWDGTDADGKPYRENASAYIDGAEISYDGTVWKDAKAVHYWPGTGGLTFFAYAPSDLTENTAGTGVSITAAEGVQYTGWRAEKDAHSCDFMVAEPAKDRTDNTVTYYRTGVPMLFRHALAQIQFVANMETDKNTVYVEKLTLKNIYMEADYVQGSSSAGNWGNRKEPSAYVLFSSPTPTKLTTAETVLMPDGMTDMLMIPQNLSERLADDENGVKRDAPLIEIVYYTGEHSDANRKTATIKFTDIRSYVWEMGVRMKYTITFGNVDIPILFDPVPGDWNDNYTATLPIG